MSDPEDEGFVLFRQAVLERDMHAWECIHRRYRVLLIAWARQCTLSALLTEQHEDIADQAFARAWAALTPERFNEFPGLAAILGYLRNCVGTVVIDMARAQATRDRTAQKLSITSPLTPEQIVLDGIEHATFWNLITGLIETPQEEIILRYNLICGQPPRLILARFSELFASIADVYSTKRNLLCRLKRNLEIQRLACEIRIGG